jgi:hypothetical protein
MSGFDIYLLMVTVYKQIMKIQEENNVILPLRAQESVQHIQLPSVSGTGNMAIGTASPSKSLL